MMAFGSGVAAAPRRVATASPRHWPSRLASALQEWWHRHRARHQRRVLSDHLCQDIGISKAVLWPERRNPPSRA